ncbi:MAG: hypothetical protein OMM_05511 [Candidatus Magnetoglobus multicellularis str. Araruama]|uniref:Fibronectin type-III domain-containing protein n=1 Tax=Candidatus Magnetoglobus multicellularis str. Araruama TaxID=890399 RepID=A0A1V1NVW2_9BACT|nr:MAG: hypothetical protein OMM_05511 [Candidatus Magnetoglobus multicellularis str. Araruama]
MIYSYYKNTIPTVQDIKNLDDWLFENEELPINNYNGSYTTCDILKRLSINHGGFSETEVHRDWTMEGLVDELQKGYPVIVAVRLRMSSEVTTSNGHFMVLRGIDQNYVYVNDPGRSLGSGHGKNKKYSKQEFLASWNTQGRACVTIHSELSGGGGSDQPLNLVSELAQNKIVLGWDHPDSELPLSYQILRNGNYINSVESNYTYYTDTSVEPGVLYCYTVRSEFEENLSGPSNEICIELSKDSDEIDLENGLVAYYPFNGNANDESGNGNHGVVHGASLAEDRFLNKNSAYSFDGYDDYIQIDGIKNIFSNDFTVSLWVNFHSFDDKDYPSILYLENCNLILHGMGPVYDQFGEKNLISFYQQNDCNNPGTNPSTSRIGQMTSQIKLQEKTWYLITISKFNNNFNMYINNELQVQLQSDESITFDGSVFLGLRPFFSDRMQTDISFPGLRSRSEFGHVIMQGKFWIFQYQRQFRFSGACFCNTII